MNWKLEINGYDNESDNFLAENIPEHEPGEITSDQEVAGNSSGDDPFFESPENQESLRKRFANMAAKHTTAVEATSAHMLDMFSHKEVIQRAKLANRQKEFELLQSLLQQMRNSPEQRRLMAQPMNYSDVLDDLGKRYPHFGNVIEVLRARMRLNALKKHPVIDFGANILLLGAPGCGKSSFLYELGESLGTRFHAISCASSTTGAELTGLSATWGNGHHGAIHELLVQLDCANPIMLLDEIDKAESEGKMAFTGALYGLLEKNNASKFKDEYVSVTINASRINWFASANDLSTMDAPIRDRFEVIRVNAPSRDELRQILPGLYDKLVRNHGLQDIYACELPARLIEAVLGRGTSIRRLKALLDGAIANASVRAGEGQGPLILRLEDLPRAEYEQGNIRKIGFIH